MIDVPTEPESFFRIEPTITLFSSAIKSCTPVVHFVKVEDFADSTFVIVNLLVALNRKHNYNELNLSVFRKVNQTVY
ncbi:hypothetical protein GCM10028805_30050 [Spirosoma harenae]